MQNNPATNKYFNYICLHTLNYGKTNQTLKSRLVDSIIDLTSCMVKLETCSYSTNSQSTPKANSDNFFLETNSKASLEPSRSTLSTASMVAPVLHVKSEQSYNQYKLCANHLPKFNCKSNIHNFLMIFENCLQTAPDSIKASLILNCLDSNSKDLSMINLPPPPWSYTVIRAP